MACLPLHQRTDHQFGLPTLTGCNSRLAHNGTGHHRGGWSPPTYCRGGLADGSIAHHQVSRPTVTGCNSKLAHSGIGHQVIGLPPSTHCRGRLACGSIALHLYSCPPYWLTIVQVSHRPTQVLQTYYSILRAPANTGSMTPASPALTPAHTVIANILLYIEGTGQHRFYDTGQSCIYMGRPMSCRPGSAGQCTCPMTGFCSTSD